MVTAEPTVTVTEYTVSCLPEAHEGYRRFRIKVSYAGGGRWTVEHCGYFLAGQGAWHPSATYAERFTLDDALWTAKQAAPDITVNGLTVADVLARAER